MSDQAEKLLITAPPEEGLLPRIRGTREAHLWHVRKLSRIMAGISLNKEEQDSPNSCSD